MSTAKARPKKTPDVFPTEKTSKNHSLFPSKEPEYLQQPAPEIPDSEGYLSEEEQPNSEVVTYGITTPAQCADNTICTESDTSLSPIRIQRLNISQITQDAGLQSRVKMNPSTVRNYAEGFRNGDNLPNPDVFEIDGRYFLVDGFHRIAAAQQENWKDIECTVHFGTIRDAKVFAAGVNATHGLPRTNADKHLVMDRVLNDPDFYQWSNVQIGKICNVSESFVRSLRMKRSETSPQSRTYVDKYGNTSKMQVNHIGKKIVKVQPPLDILNGTPSALEVSDLVVIPEYMHPAPIRSEIAVVIPDLAVIDNNQSLSTRKPMSSNEMRPNQIADKLVQCLSKDQRDFLYQIIKSQEAGTNLEAIGFVLDWAINEKRGME